MPARVRPQPGIAARFEASCARCHRLIAIGDRIVHQRGAYIHVTCASGQDDE